METSEEIDNPKLSEKTPRELVLECYDYVGALFTSLTAAGSVFSGIAVGDTAMTIGTATGAALLLHSRNELLRTFNRFFNDHPNVSIFWLIKLADMANNLGAPNLEFKSSELTRTQRIGRIVIQITQHIVEYKKSLKNEM